MSPDDPHKTEPDARPRHAHIGELDGVRAVSILLVLACHMLPLGPKELQLNYAAGLMGMSLFFCLSGFLITRFLWDRQDVAAFFSRRLLRIVPAVLLFLTVLLAFGLPLRSYLLNLAFVSNYVPGALSGGPVGHLWSLSVEVQFYAAIGLAVLLLGRRALWLVPPACLAVTALRIDTGTLVDIKTHLRVDEILIGGCLALAAPFLTGEGRAARALRRHALPGLAAASVLWILSSHPSGGGFGYFRPYFAGALVGLALFGGWRPLGLLLRHRAMAYVATISYALYLWHPLMTHGIMNEGSVAERYLLKRPLSLVATFAAAHASTFGWERRWTRVRSLRDVPGILALRRRFHA